MATAAPGAGSDAIRQLNEARKLSLNDHKLYSQIVPGVLPIIGAHAELDLQRWGADYLAETLASPVLPADDKTRLALQALPVLRGYLEKEDEDSWVVKSAVQAVASCYPLVFRYIIDHPTENAQWQTMAAIKSNVLRRMDSAPPGVRICCIKFVQRVVQAQTPGLIADPRRPEQNEISLALVPRDHPIIPPPNLEAEASGLLDRLLSILQENSSDALLVTATLNCLGGLIRTRASIANKILNTVLNFNPLKLANSPMTPKSKVLIRSMERTTKALLVSVIKKNPNHVLAARIQQYLERLHQSRTEILDEANRKRAAPADAGEGMQAKRPRLVPGQAQWPPPLRPGPVTVAEVFALGDNPISRTFDVRGIRVEDITRAIIVLLQATDQSIIERAINAVRARWLSLTDPNTQTTLNTPQSGRLAVDDDDDDYEPDYAPTEDAEQLNNRLDQDASAIDAIPPDVTLGPFRLPTPPPLTERETAEWSRKTVSRVLDAMRTLDIQGRKTLQQTSSFNRLAARNHDRDALITVLSRLATRAVAGLEDGDTVVKKEPNGANGNTAAKGAHSYQIADAIREELRMHVVQDFRRKIDVAIQWLNEEWYNDRVLRKAYEDEVAAAGDHFTASEDAEPPVEPPRHYEKWLLRMMDGFLPYLDAKDKVLIRFLSEVPELNANVLERVKSLARDPERVQLAVTTLQYLVMLKPPARELAIDALEDLWRNYSDAKNAAAKVLAKWRPVVLQEQANGAGAAGEGVKAEATIEAKA